MGRMEVKRKIDSVSTIFKITIREMLSVIYPRVGLFVQGFYASCILMFLIGLIEN